MLSLEPLTDSDLREILDLLDEQTADSESESSFSCGRKVKTTYRDKDVVTFFDTTNSDPVIAHREAVNWWSECGESAFNNVAPSNEF